MPLIVCYRVQKPPFALAVLLQLENYFLFVLTLLHFSYLTYCYVIAQHLKTMAFNPRTYHRGVLASRRYLFNHYFTLLQ